MIVVSGHVKTEPGALEKVRAEMEAVIEATRAENGCVAYSYGVDVLDPDTMLVVEWWESWAALEAHFTAPHMAPWLKAMGAAGIVSRSLKAVQAGVTRDL